MTKQTKPQPPVDNPVTDSDKRGKGFPPVKGSWGATGSPGRGPFDPNDGKRVLRESVGWED